MSMILLDTCGLLWAGREPEKLSPAAAAVLAAPDARWAISAITLVELRYLIERNRIPSAAWDETLARVADAANPLAVLPVDVRVVSALDAIPRDRVPDMPDRIIAATAVAYALPLVTRDAKIRTANALTIIW